jgi:hypothetical protein
MIILRVAMGQAWRKETAKEISSALVFAEPAPVREQSEVVKTTIFNAEDPISRPLAPENNHGAPVYEHTNTTCSGSSV